MPGNARWWLVAAALMLLSACTTRDPTNPLDSDNPDTGGAPRWLSALADNGAVDLRWDVPEFDDLLEVRLVDLAGPEVLWTGAAGDTTFRHLEAPNGVERRYRLELALAGGGLVVLPEETATPGPAVAYAVDAVSGTLVRLTPDGRDIRWRSTRLDASSARVDPDSAWVLAVEFFRGRVTLVDREGVVRWSNEDFVAPLLSLRADEGWWITDTGVGAVVLLDEQGVTALADSSFDFPTDLAPAGGGAVWVADRAGFVARVEIDGGFTGDPVTLGEPVTLAATGDGGVWVGDRGLAVAVRLDAAGREVARTETISRIQSMVPDPAVPGGFWLVERDEGRLLRGDGEGTLVTVVDGLPGPSSLVVSPDGEEVWVADPALAAVVRFDRTGRELGRSRGLGAPTSVAVAFHPGLSGP